ncbi:DUF2845 domain-containing protein [Mitsuaria sp. 7]|uniref:DUF2845 domain-containing protein n=1 Tax=Mitsuaria sp. 7 TaxID=1658665 RepID=UPI0007DD34B5|nr:DUF2845 domain-containing protein [Mitsuaria sp. 7]ANH67686.1 hypothetical protein ABE85_09100 [Mitsuaria sp. 7]
MTRSDRHGWALRALAAGALLVAGSATQAQSLRCTEGGVREGDSKVFLLRACGQPAIADSYCARVLTNAPPPVPYFQGQTLVQPVPQVQCVMTDEWLYERGEGYLPAVIRLREGRIISIRFGEQGKSEPR